ncbi:MAG: N-acetyltransferase [ANME-2 cluster archaeon]|nr:N-acetyltransferase [ANME-2 cluster archaeon]MBC2701625.1 N-acetyltransferase [ANME-2 cluster archaeon]MBC2708290.1 N-acetyltransferase [ANME-2 cluster archaeon]MBC2764355.1 N-acetyltransferase [ANME-2 cluster archaeon]
MQIRPTKESDLHDVLLVEKAAFGTEEGKEIADLVNDLLVDPSAMPILSLIAIKDYQAIGHILFTKAIIDSNLSISAVILAPLAVIPAAQSQGVGGQLINEGLKCLSESGVDLVFVLGHPDYYPRHGFKPASILGFDAPYPIQQEHADAWMVKELRFGVIGSVSGKVQCSDVLNQPEHWRE